jgi:TolA-binding protein
VASGTGAPSEPPPSSEPARETEADPEAPKATGLAPAPRAALPAASASTLFDEARQAREHFDYSVAVERYTRLLALFPSSPQAVTTHAVLGRLLLDRGEPRAALEQFDAYLGSGSTTLAEEATLGRALAFGRLGQNMQEVTAWQALLSAYPNSLHASRAHDRLHALHAE